ncbi:BglG family transcription antiterminator [Salimicrobium album]|uniref:Mannitol operon transcriptional antiterminator n=1 Tax=Salimicrobium album TaxID=50717 RepID=A0A1H3FWY2_9BACI|nr:BglG family transcription antiterminator [Salimicrobium album]SDX95592.1 mannitol operon transcriptional antiterminator [Salimicrobium album]
MYVTGRERKILELLLNEEEVTIKDIAEELKVSTRTIHRSLKGLESILQERDIEIKRTKDSLLYLDGSAAGKKELEAVLGEQASADYTADERQLLLLQKLLESAEPLKLTGLASDMNVTTATVSNDLDRAEDYVKNFGLELIRKRGYGVEIIGKEKQIREAMNHLIMTHMNENDFFSLLEGSRSTATLISDITKQLLGLVNPESLTLIEESVRELKEELPYGFSDDAYISLVVHLALAVERIRQEETIEIDNEFLARMKKQKEYNSATLLSEELEKRLKLGIPEAEVAYITGHLMGAKARYAQEYWLEESSLSTAFKAKQLIEFMTKRTRYNFHESDRLLKDLVVHLKPSIYRLQQNMEIANPFTSRLEEDYPELFYLLEEGLYEVFREITFPKDEIAYIVMHFASAIINMEKKKPVKALVVCSSGIGTAKILSAKLLQQFPAIKTIEHGSLFDVDQWNESDYDLIVSTVPLQEPVDYVLVNPVLQERDNEKIAYHLRKIQVTSGSIENNKNHKKETEDGSFETLRYRVMETKRYAEAISELMDTFCVTKAVGKDPNEFLHFIIGQLAEKEVLPYDPDLVEKLMEREQVGGLGIPGTTAALFHTRKEDVERISFTIHFLEVPVSLSSMSGGHMETDTILLMLSPADPSEEQLETLSFISTLLVERKDCRDVLEQKEEEVLKNYFSKRLHEYFDSTIKGEDNYE